MIKTLIQTMIIAVVITAIIFGAAVLCKGIPVLGIILVSGVTGIICTGVWFAVWGFGT